MKLSQSIYTLITEEIRRNLIPSSNFPSCLIKRDHTLRTMWTSTTMFRGNYWFENDTDNHAKWYSRHSRQFDRFEISAAGGEGLLLLDLSRSNSNDLGGHCFCRAKGERSFTKNGASAGAFQATVANRGWWGEGAAPCTLYDHSLETAHACHWWQSCFGA